MVEICVKDKPRWSKPGGCESKERNLRNDVIAEILGYKSKENHLELYIDKKQNSPDEAQ